MKRNNLLLLFMLMVILIAFVGCANNNSNNSTSSTSSIETNTENIKDIPVSELAESIISNDSLGFGMLFDSELESIAELIDLDSSLVDDFSFKDTITVQSAMVYIAKAKNSSGVEAIKTAFESRLSMVQKSFENYLPEPYEMAKNGKVVVKGNYVMMIICADTDKAIEIFNTSLTQ